MATFKKPATPKAAAKTAKTTKDRTNATVHAATKAVSKAAATKKAAAPTPPLWGEERALEALNSVRPEQFRRKQTKGLGA